MGIKSRIGVEGISYYPIFTRLGAVLGRAAKMHLLPLKEGVAVGMFASGCLPYEATKTYRKIMAEHECKLTKTRVDAQHALLRGL